jgi:hypothetical protein
MPVDPTNDISGFINQFAGGGVRTNLFAVTGNIPGYSNNRAISFLCKAAQIPASSLGTIEVPYRGRRIKLPGDRTFQDWTITVISDSNMQLRSAFENWSAQLNAHVANTGATNFMQTLMPQWSVTQLLRNGDALRTYNFLGCFPSEIGAIDLSYENNDSIAEFPVTINYSYWVAAAGAAGNNATGGGNLLGSLLQGLGLNIGSGF